MFEESASLEPSGAEIIGIEDGDGKHSFKIISIESAEESRVEKLLAEEDDLFTKDKDKLKKAKKVDMSDDVTEQQIDKKGKTAEEKPGAKKQKAKHPKEEDDVDKPKLASEDIDSLGQAVIDDKLSKVSSGDDKLGDARKAKCLDSKLDEDADKLHDSDLSKQSKPKGIAVEDDSDRPQDSTSSKRKPKAILVEDDSDIAQDSELSSSQKSKGIAGEDEEDKPQEAYTFKLPKSKSIATEEDGEKPQEPEKIDGPRSRALAAEDEGEKEIEALMERIQRQRSLLEDILDHGPSEVDLEEGSDHSIGIQFVYTIITSLTQ